MFFSKVTIIFFFHFRCSIAVLGKIILLEKIKMHPRYGFVSCTMSLVQWILDKVALEVLKSTQSSARKTGSEHDRLSHPGSPSVALLLLEKAQLEVTAHREGWSPVSARETQSSCPSPQFDAEVLIPDHTSCSESGTQHKDLTSTFNDTFFDIDDTFS